MQSRYSQYKTSIEYFQQPVEKTEIYSVYTGPNNVSNEPYKYIESVVETHQKIDNSPTIMKSETSNFANTSDPRVWGPSFWFSLHNGVSKYPENASPYVIERMKGFILGIPMMLPCEKCKVHATNYIDQNSDKIDQICQGRTSLFQFFVDFHNMVNKTYNKPILSYEQAWKIYNKGIDIKIMNYK